MKKRLSCRFCGTDAEGDLRATLLALQSCNNCLVDIQCKGQWTGDGWAVLQRLIERHGGPEGFKAALTLLGLDDLVTPRGA